MRRILYISCFLSLFLCFAFAGANAAWSSSSYTFFQGTQHPLRVEYLEGEEPGATVMIQGGIQGDEPSGFITAQLLTKSVVKRGSLLIVPRANLPSIHAGKRQINVDLNRRFDRDYNQFYEDRLARVIRYLISGCDAFIHLHEGSGFYHPEYIDSLRNPGRYGQSIIIDTTVFEGRIHLAEIVTRVLKELNTGINPDYKFRLFNTDTFAGDTLHPEQRKSLTFYALRNRHIPAMAVEVSKDIKDIPWKVRHQLNAVCLLLEEFGVVIEPPDFSNEDIEKAWTKGAVRLNGKDIELQVEKEIDLSVFSKIKPDISEGEDDLVEPAWCAFASDRPGVNILDAPRIALQTFNTLEIHADGVPVGKVNLKWKGNWPKHTEDSNIVLVCWLNGRLKFIPQGETLEGVRGDQLILEGIWGSDKDEIINLKGFVGRPGKNDGQDAGMEIVLEPDNFMDKYALDSQGNKGWRYRIKRETPNSTEAEFFLRIVPRRILALKLKSKEGESIYVGWKPDHLEELPPGEYEVEGALTNGELEKILLTSEHTVPVDWGRTLNLKPGESRSITLRYATTFLPIGRMTLTSPRS